MVIDERSSSFNHAETRNTIKKVFKTISLALCWVCLGLMMELYGPTLIDLKARTNSSYEALATAVASKNIGYFVGAILGGVLVDKCGFFCDLMLALSLDATAFATIGVPWASRVELIGVLCFIKGVGGGVLNTSGMKLIINMWLEKSTSPMHVLHGGYGIGSFLIPLIANPFLAVSPSTNLGTSSNDTTGHAFTVMDVKNDTTTSIPDKGRSWKESRIEIAFLIPAVLAISLSLIFHGYNFLNIKENKKQKEKSIERTIDTKSVKFKQMLNPASCAGGDQFYGLQIFILLFLYFLNCIGGERVNGLFLRTYSIEHFGFSKDDGSYINTAFWVSHTVGRYAGFLTARWIPIRLLVLFESGGLLVSVICHAALSGRSAIALWIIAQPVGFFIGPLFPSGIGWGNYHLRMTGSAIAVLQLGASCGSFVYMKLIGFLYDTYGPHTYLYCLLANGILMFSFTVLLDAVGVFHEKRAKNKTDKMSEIIENVPSDSKGVELN